MLPLCRITLVVMPLTLYGGLMSDARSQETVPAPVSSDSSPTQQLEVNPTANIDYLSVLDQQLVYDARSLNDTQAATSLIYLTYRAVESPDAIVGNSNLAWDLYAITVELVKESALHKSRTRQSAAAQCVKHLITSAINPNHRKPSAAASTTTFDWLLCSFKEIYRGSQDTKLAILAALDAALKADLASFNKVKQEIATDRVKLKEKQTELAAIALSNKQLVEFITQEAENISLSMSRSETFLGKLDTNAVSYFGKLGKVDDAKDIERVYNTLTPELQLIEQYMLIRDRTKAQQSILWPSDDKRLKNLALDLYKTKLDQFKREREITALAEKIRKSTENRRDEVLKQNALTLLAFIESTRQPNDSKLVREVADSISVAASSALITYSGSSAFDDAGALLLATSGSFLEPDASGSRTSAAP